MVVAAVLGGGRGSRMGGEMPKQFLPLGGEAVILHSLRAFLQNARVDACLLLAPEEYVPFTETLVQNAGLTGGKTPVTVLAGGETRGDTLLLALEYTRETWGLTDTVLITHDAARPFVTQGMIEENIAGAEAYGAVNTCIPATDTVFLSVDGRFIADVPARKNVFHAQTPQTFRADVLYDLIKAMPPEEFTSLTDGCSVFVKAGKPVYMARGSENNIKITFPGDINRAEQILRRMINN